LFLIFSVECGGSTPLSFFVLLEKKESGVEPPHSKLKTEDGKTKESGVTSPHSKVVALLDHPNSRQRPVDDNGSAEHQTFRNEAPASSVGRGGTVVAKAKIVARLYVVRFNISGLILFIVVVIEVAPKLEFRHRDTPDGTNAGWLVFIDARFVELLTIGRWVIASGSEV